LAFVVAGGCWSFAGPGWLGSSACCGLGCDFGILRLICPLTPLENAFRAKGGAAGYTGGFVEHYVVPLLYPEQLTSWHQALMGVFVVAVNAVLYGLWFRRRRRANSNEERRETKPVGAGFPRQR
jgi:hypothetical protein